MDCVTCTITDVCKIADSVKAAGLYATLTVTNCSIKARLGDVSLKAPLAPVYEAPASILTDPLPTIAPGFKQYRDFSKESKQLEEQTKALVDNVSKVTIVSDVQDIEDIQKEFMDELAQDELPVEMKTCPTCDSQTSVADASKCSKCQKEVCFNCKTETSRGELCDACWNE